MQYSFIMANFLAVIMFLVVMANFGAADQIYGNDFVVIDSTENPSATNQNYDFDLASIKFNPSYDPSRIRSNALKNGSIIFSSNMTFRNDGRLTVKDSAPFGEVAYDVSGRSDTVFLPYNNNAFFEDNTQFLLSEQSPPNTTRAGITSIPYDEIVGSSPIGLNLENQSTMVLGIDGGSGAYIDVSGGFVNTDSNFLDTGARVLNNAALAVAEVPRVIRGYIDFILSVPGLLGTILRLYFGLMLTILLVDLIWLG